MKTNFFLVALLSLFYSISFAQTRPRDLEPVPNYDVPYEPEIHDMYRTQYEYGYRLGKMYALRRDNVTYQSVMENATQSRNNSTGDYMYYESQILGMTAGWEDTIKASGGGAGQTAAGLVKDAMSMPYGSMASYRQAAGNPFYWSAGGGPPRKYYWRVDWDLTTFGIEVAKIRLH